jgi:hypothetical protein
VWCGHTEQRSGRATIAEKYKKDRKEDVALLKKARCHLSSEKFKKIYDVWDGLRLRGIQDTVR